MKLNLDDAAVMLWLPKGEKPRPEHFEIHASLGPPNPNPEPWWHLSGALLNSRIVDNHGKEPWIKVGGNVLSPAQVLRAYEALKNGQDIYV
jgi:hypothetical protein